MEFNISHSLINGYNDVELHGACGTKFHEINLLKNFETDSKSFRQGKYMEYRMTGAIPRDGKIPEPERTQKGELTAVYKYIEAQVENFNAQMKFYELTIADPIKDVNVTVETVFKGVKVKTVMDIIATNKHGKKVIIDTKCTGLIEDRWNDYGWHLDKLPGKERLTNQAVLYTWIYKQVFGEDIDFYWWLHSPSNPIDSKIIKAVILSTAYDRIEKKIVYTKEGIDNMEAFGFEPRPGKHNCILNVEGDKCPVATCTHRMEVPIVSTVEIS